MDNHLTRRRFLQHAATAAAAAVVPRFDAGALLPTTDPDGTLADGRYLYVAVPGIRDYLEYGGTGILVFDMDDGYRFVRRISTPNVDPAINVKGVCANARTGRLYFSTTQKVFALDLLTERLLWVREYTGGTDRLALSPNGRVMYVPSFEGPHWNVVDAGTGEVTSTLVLNSRAHNTLFGPDGRRVYLAGLASPWLSVADARRHRVIHRVGPFAASIRPFTINARQTLCFVNVNELLGFEVGDIRRGIKLHRVTVQGFEPGPVKRHGCPSHGVGLTPDEREVWVVDGHNSHVHVFAATTLPPRQVASIPVRDQPGWISFSRDGAHAWPSTGEGRGGPPDPVSHCHSP